MKQRSDPSPLDPCPRVLCVGGIDPTGGSGIAADLRALHSLGVFGAVAVTATTVQTSLAVTDISPVSGSLIEAQIEAALSEPGIDVVKTGMLVSEDGVLAVSRCLSRRGGTSLRLVVDPVLIASSGRRLLSTEGAEALSRELLPRAALVTPNLPELAALSGSSVDGPEQVDRAADVLLLRGAGAVLVKGGHDDQGDDVVDRLYTADGERLSLSRPRKPGSFRGTGCTLASAIAGSLAEGLTLSGAVERGRDYVESAMAQLSCPGLGTFLLPAVPGWRDAATR